MQLVFTILAIAAVALITGCRWPGVDNHEHRRPWPIVGGRAVPAPMVSRFAGALVIEPDEDERTALMHESIGYYSELLARWIFIPKGFRTDGASVPRLFWNIIPPWGRYGMAAIVHDYLYRWQKTTRHVADDVLLEAMKVKRCAFWQYACIWSAVRLFGAFAWRADQAKPLSTAEAAVNL